MIPEAELEAFKAKHVNMEKLKWGSPEAEERIKRVRVLQYIRWEWACDNLPVYVNMLRCMGHSGTAIKNMLAGTPMCFKSLEDYRQLRIALRELVADIKEEMGWTNVNFVLSGSSVPGFSQNPLKGFADTPSKITSTKKSDVDISIVGDGINQTMTQRLEAGMAEPKRCFATTCSATTQATRLGCWDMESACKSAFKFKEKWELKLTADLQFTLCEDDNATLPWEARIDIDNVDPITANGN